MQIVVTPQQTRELLKSLGRVTVADKIRADELTPEEVQVLAGLFPAWEAGLSVQVNELYRYGDAIYQVVQAHTTQEGWEPPAVPALFTAKAAPGVIPAWVQPTGAQDAYGLNDKVTHNGQTWTSTAEANVWEPGVYGWTQD